MLRILIVILLAAAIGWILWRMFTSRKTPSWARTSAKPCRWKLRAPARNGFPARWRCSVCNADVSAPENFQPSKCFQVGPKK